MDSQEDFHFEGDIVYSLDVSNLSTVFIIMILRSEMVYILKGSAKSIIDLLVISSLSPFNFIDYIVTAFGTTFCVERILEENKQSNK